MSLQIKAHDAQIPANVPEHLRETYDSALGFYQSRVAPHTLRAYQSDFRIFSEWCGKHGLPHSPAKPESVALFLAAQAKAGLAVVTLERRLAAIRFSHIQHDLPSPTEHRVVLDVLGGIRRSFGVRAKNQRIPLMDHQVARMLNACPHTTLGIRDRALLALAFAGAFRRSELVALKVEDLNFTSSGNLICLIRRSKTDQIGAGFEKPILNGQRLRPVTHLQAWLQHAGIEDGLVFRKIDYAGGALEAGLSGQWVAKRIKHYANRIGLDARMIAAHSMRSGFITSAGEHGQDFSRIMEVTGQTDPRTVQRYLRRQNKFKDHAGENFL